MPEITTGAIAKKIAALPPHVQAGLAAYRKALSKRQDWHRAVTAAIEAAEAAKEAEKPFIDWACIG